MGVREDDEIILERDLNEDVLKLLAEYGLIPTIKKQRQLRRGPTLATRSELLIISTGFYERSTGRDNNYKRKAKNGIDDEHKNRTGLREHQVRRSEATR